MKINSHENVPQSFASKEKFVDMLQKLVFLTTSTEGFSPIGWCLMPAETLISNLKLVCGIYPRMPPWKFSSERFLVVFLGLNEFFLNNFFIKFFGYIWFQYLASFFWSFCIQRRKNIKPINKPVFIFWKHWQTFLDFSVERFLFEKIDLSWKKVRCSLICRVLLFLLVVNASLSLKVNTEQQQHSIDVNWFIIIRNVYPDTHSLIHLTVTNKVKEIKEYK